MKISGCAAIVTGGCQGIGRGIVYALLRKNAKVGTKFTLYLCLMTWFVLYICLFFIFCTSRGSN